MVVANVFFTERDLVTLDRDRMSAVEQRQHVPSIPVN